MPKYFIVLKLVTGITEVRCRVTVIAGMVHFDTQRSWVEGLNGFQTLNLCKDLAKPIQKEVRLADNQGHEEKLSFFI